MLNFLPADYPSLRFDVAGQQSGFKWQWVSPMFWGGLSTLLQYKQMAARAACEQLAAALPEAGGAAMVLPAQPITPLLTPAVTRNLYLKLLEHPALVSELSAYQQSELRTYAENEQLTATRLAVELMDSNPHYNYPVGYLNGREVEYWQGTISSYADSERVLHLLTPHAPASPSIALAITEPLLAITVAELCLGSFTTADLSNLLVRLAVLDTKGNCLTNELRGKARGKRGAFTAAYRVLHRAGLLAPVATDREWADAFRKEYKVELGADVITHQITPHGHAVDSTPIPFQRAVDDATVWVAEWKNHR